MPVDVLAFAAHPDDIELACSGLMLKLKSQGYTTGIIDLTRGELGTRGDAETRFKESETASKILGITVRENAAIQDGNIETNRGNQIKVIESIRKHRPKLILCPYWHDRHPDHVAASKLVEKSVFYSGLVKLKTEYDAHRPGNVVYYFQHELAEPSFIVDISDEFETKIKVIRAYKSQFYDAASKEPQTYISSPAFFDSIITRAKYLGYKIGVQYGEPYLVKSAIKVDNIVEMFA